jgi:hypothetical protein
MCLRKGGSAKFDPDRLLTDESFSASRKRMREKQTPERDLKRQAGALLRLCLRRLPEAFADNKANMEAFIELSHPYPQDVIDALKARFEKAGFKVEHTFRDEKPTYDHLGFTPPKDWIERLLAMSEAGEKALDEAVQVLVGG